MIAMNPPSAFRTGAVLPAPYSMRRRGRRVPVTSCDQCRLKKMRCDSKEKGTGTACSNCEKHKRTCTFHDKETDEAESLAAKALAAAQKAAPKKRVRGMGSSGSNVQRTRASFDWSGPSRSYQPFDPTAFDPSAAGIAPYGMSPPTFGSNAGPSMQALTDPMGRSFTPWEAWNPQGRSMSLPGPSTSAWSNYFPTPSSITSPETGIAEPIHAEAFIEMLLRRFYSSEPSVAVLLAPPQNEMLSRFRQSSPMPYPLYLVQVVVACTAATVFSPEPEVRAWAVSAWRGAVEATQERLLSPQPPDLELIEALLLLTVTSAGNPAANERYTSFQTALGLARGPLGLTSHERMASSAPQEKSRRLRLFWSLWIVDKLLAAARETGPLMSEVEMPTIDVLSIMGLGASATEAQTLQSLGEAALSLARILDAVQSQLWARVSTIADLRTVHATIVPLEVQLEQWCKTNRSVLSEVQQPLSCAVATGIISLLHFVQLQLYSFPLRYESAARGGAPITFDSTSAKALIGCMESSLHLVRRVPSFQDSKGAIREAMHMNNPATTPMSFTGFLVDRGSAFLRFLSTSWSEWNDGDGIHAYLPANEAVNTAGTPVQTAQDVTSPCSAAGGADVESPAPQSTELPQTEGFLGRRSSVLGKKGAPAPLPLGQTQAQVKVGAALASAIPRIDTATFATLGIPMTPAHQLFEDLSRLNNNPSQNNGGNPSGDAATTVAAPTGLTGIWPSADWLSNTNTRSNLDNFSMPSASLWNSRPSAPMDFWQSERNGQKANVASALGFDLQAPLVSPVVSTHQSHSRCPGPLSSGLVAPAVGGAAQSSDATMPWDRQPFWPSHNLGDGNVQDASAFKAEIMASPDSMRSYQQIPADGSSTVFAETQNNNLRDMAPAFKRNEDDGRRQSFSWSMASYSEQ